MHTPDGPTKRGERSSIFASSIPRSASPILEIGSRSAGRNTSPSSRTVCVERGSQSDGQLICPRMAHLGRTAQRALCPESARKQRQRRYALRARCAGTSNDQNRWLDLLDCRLSACSEFVGATCSVCPRPSSKQPFEIEDLVGRKRTPIVFPLSQGELPELTQHLVSASQRGVMRRRGGPRNADWRGRNADAIGIGPVHGVGTVVDGGTRRAKETPRVFPLL
jgi:hypothetical protein